LLYTGRIMSQGISDGTRVLVGSSLARTVADPRCCILGITGMVVQISKGLEGQLFVSEVWLSLSLSRSLARFQRELTLCIGVCVQWLRPKSFLSQVCTHSPKR